MAWGEQVRVRMGVHTGEAAQTVTGLVGLDVHRAARVAAVAYGGQVLLSETAAALVRDSLPPGAALRDLGVHRLKDLGRPEQIFQLDVPGLQAEFPPLRSLGNPALPNNLPAQLATFIGRERELSDVRGLVGSARLVTLTGAGGSGKTRLGLQVAAELLDGSGDGVWLAELAAVSDEDAVAPAICRALGIATRPGRPVPETLLDALALQDVLIVLDNCEHLIGACAKTAEAILRQLPEGPPAGHQPRAAGHRRRDDLPGAAVVAARARRRRLPGARVLGCGRAVRRAGQGAGRRPARR